MRYALSLAVYVTLAPSTLGGFVCDVTRMYDDSASLVGACDGEGEFTGTEFMPGDTFPLDSLDKISGTLPRELADLHGTLQRLWLANNLVSGTVPTEYGTLTNLVDLQLHGDRLSGTLPTELGMLTALTELRLDSNSISGFIPASFTALSKLTDLQLHSNQMSGSVPSGVAGLDPSIHPDLFISPASPPGSSPASPPSASNDSSSSSEDSAAPSTSHATCWPATLAMGSAAGLVLMSRRH